MGTIPDREFSRCIERIDALIQSIERSADPALRADAQGLLQAVLELHGAGLSRILDRVAQEGAPGRAVLDDLASDDLVRNVLLLHDLHPVDLESRVLRALDSVRPQLRGHGGEVTLVDVVDGVVRLRLEGNCHGCPSSAQTMKHLIEEAIIDAAPDATSIEVEGLAGSTPAPAGLITIDQLLIAHGKAGVSS